MEVGIYEELPNFVPSKGEVVFAFMGRHKKGHIYECPFHVIQFSWVKGNTPRDRFQLFAEGKNKYTSG